MNLLNIFLLIWIIPILISIIGIFILSYKGLKEESYNTKLNIGHNFTIADLFKSVKNAFVDDGIMFYFGIISIPIGGLIFLLILLYSGIFYTYKIKIDNFFKNIKNNLLKLFYYIFYPIIWVCKQIGNIEIG